MLRTYSCGTFPEVRNFREGHAARNPLPASYVREHGAVGALSFALELGEAILDAEPAGAEAVMEAVAESLGGRIAGRFRA